MVFTESAPLGGEKNKDQDVIQQGSGGCQQDFFGIRATIRIGQETLCFPYAGFYKYIYIYLNLPLFSNF